jgi:hypothetical protein
MAPVQPLFMLRIEVDGHCRGGPPIKPWVARIRGADAQYGLGREFVQPMQDWAQARRAWSGNLYGVVSTYPLRDGCLYEVHRAEGTPSQRHATRSFYELSAGRLEHIETIALLQRVADGAPGASLSVREFPGRTLVTDLAEDAGVVAYAVVGQKRIYWLREGRAYDVRDVDARDADRCRVLRVTGGRLCSEDVAAWPSRQL